MGVLEKLRTREQDFVNGVKIDDNGVTEQRFPRIARANEVVGAYAWGLVALVGSTSILNKDLPQVGEPVEGENIPSPDIRRFVGGIINSGALAISSLVTARYGIDILEATRYEP